MIQDSSTKETQMNIVSVCETISFNAKTYRDSRFSPILKRRIADLVHSGLAWIQVNDPENEILKQNFKDIV